MADGQEMTFEEPAQAISQGKRNLLVRDYGMAVTALAQGCGMLAEKHGEMADELGEPFLLYGRALLCLSREEAGVLGSGVPGTEDNDEEDADEPEEEEAEEEEDGAEKEKEAETDAAKPPNGTQEKEALNGEKAAEKTEVKSADKSDEPMDESEATAEKKPEEKKPAEENSSKSAAGSSKMNGEASTSTAHQNGDAHENGEEMDVDEEDDEDANSNLQLAWEVLELAKLILLKRGPPAWKLLAEAHRLLGEVAMESGNQPGALTDLNACLDLLRKIEPVDPRSLAETHYQLGLAYSLGNEFDASIEQFQEATNLLEARIKDLEAQPESTKTDKDPFYSVAGEIKELKELLPEIQDKITDMRDFKQEACKLVIEGIKSKVASGGCSNGAGPSGMSSSGASSSSSSSKPASDISHLVRKKRKTEEEDSEAMSPCKKPAPEQAA